MRHFFQTFFLLSLLLWTASCANPGSGPDGGPYDETPPRVVAMSPGQGETDVNKMKKVTLVFSENIKIENAAEKIIVSPPQEELPEIKTSGKRITVELLDSLKSNTTYTIDFSDAITDATEGNPLGNFTYYFTTGENIDSLEVSGTVISADNFAPQKGFLVGLHSEVQDSVFRTKPFLRVGRTNDQGKFSIKGVAAGNYRIYALKDMDGDFRWSRGEMLAFSDEIVVPTCFQDVKRDTVWRDSVTVDSVRVSNFTHFKPDDVVLLAFQDEAKPKALLKLVREIPEKFTAYFTAPQSTLPRIVSPDCELQGALMEERSARCDTITYWIKDKSIAALDSLNIIYSYIATDDSLGIDRWRSDTLLVVPRLTNARIAKQEAEEEAKWQKQLAKRHKRGDFSQEVRPVEPIDLKITSPVPLPPDRNPLFELKEPIMSIDTAAIHLKLKVDTLFHDAPFSIEQTSLRHVVLRAEWRPGQYYELTVDSACIRGLSGKVNSPVKKSFSVTRSEEVGSLFVNLPSADTSAVVQLLVNDTKMERQVRVKAGHADFYYLRPGNYYLRVFYDTNGNGEWDTGNFSEHRQPEKVFYCPEKIVVRANWDTEQTWMPEDLPLLRQKPAELSKPTNRQRRQSGHEKNIQRMQQKGKK